MNLTLKIWKRNIVKKFMKQKNNCRSLKHQMKVFKSSYLYKKRDFNQNKNNSNNLILNFKCCIKIKAKNFYLLKKISTTLINKNKLILLLELVNQKNKSNKSSKNPHGNYNSLKEILKKHQLSSKAMLKWKDSNGKKDFKIKSRKIKRIFKI